MKGTLALLVIALGLGAYIWFVELPGETQRLEAEQVERRFLALEADEIQALDLPLGEGARVRVRRVEDGWRLETPLGYPADRGAVDAIAGALAALESRSVIEEPVEDRASYGLGEAAERVEIFTDGEGEPALVLRLGRDTPFDGQVYVGVEGRTPVYTVDSYRRDALQPELELLRDKRVVTLAPADVTALLVREDGIQVASVEREARANEDDDEYEEAKWRVVEPVADAGDARRIRRLLQDLSLARASAFVDEPDDLTSYGLDAPALEIELRSGETTQVVALGRAGDKFYALRDGAGPVFEVQERTLDQVPRTSFAFRDKTVLELDVETVQQLELHFPRDGASHSFVRSEEGWRSADESVEVDSAHPEDLLFTLAAVEATGIEEGETDRAALGLDPPLVRAVALDDSGAELGWLELGDPEPGRGMPAISSAGPRVWRVINDLGETVPLGDDVFSARWLAQLPEPEAAGEDELAEDVE